MIKLLKRYIKFSLFVCAISAQSAQLSAMNVNAVNGVNPVHTEVKHEAKRSQKSILVVKKSPYAQEKRSKPRYDTKTFRANPWLSTVRKLQSMYKTLPNVVRGKRAKYTLAARGEAVARELELLDVMAGSFFGGTLEECHKVRIIELLLDHPLGILSIECLHKKAPKFASLPKRVREFAAVRTVPLWSRLKYWKVNNDTLFDILTDCLGLYDQTVKALYNI